MAGDVAGVSSVAAPAPVVVAAPVSAAVATPTPPAFGLAYTPPQVQAPVIPYAVPTAEESEVPLWQEKPPAGGVSVYLFAAAALAVLVMAMMALNSLHLVRLPWESAPQDRPAATPASPLAIRSDYARADRFLNVNLAPAVTALNQTLTPLAQSCTGTMSISCQQSITASDQQVKKVLALIDRGDYPQCIASGVSKVRADFAAMDDGLQLALKGFADNKMSGVSQGLAKFGNAGPALSADSKALDIAFHSQCSPDRTGP
jgi:hypothetical protein